MTKNVGPRFSVQRVGRTAVVPQLDRRRAVLVLGKIDEILCWEKTKEQERDVRFVELGQYLCEMRAKQFWRAENLKSFDEFLEKRFPDSRRKAYYLMAVHEHLPKRMHRDLTLMGWTKARELVKVARSEGEKFDCAPWVHKASKMPREEFKREVDRFLTGKESERWELVYFKLYKSQIPIVEKALETAGLMLGTDKSRGYCLEMICADFLCRCNACRASIAMKSIRYSESLRQKQPRLKLDREEYQMLRKCVLERDGGVKIAVRWRSCRSIT